ERLLRKVGCFAFAAPTLNPTPYPSRMECAVGRDKPNALSSRAAMRRGLPAAGRDLLSILVFYSSLITDHCVTPPWPFHSESLASASRAASPPHRLQFSPIGRPTRTADRRASTARRPPAIAGPPAGFASPRSPTANRQAPIASRPVSSTASRPSPPF